MSESVLIGELRKHGTDLDKLFEAVRIADELGFNIEVVRSEQPTPAPGDEIEQTWQAETRKKNSAVFWFYAIPGVEK